MTYPQVDRSDFTPEFDGRMGDEVFDIGWAEGVLQDGRPYRLECWGLAGSTGITVFMASAGLEACDAAQVNTLLEKSGVVTTLATQSLSVVHFVDPARTPSLSISYVVANADDDYFIEAHPPLRMYRRDDVSAVARGEEEFLDEREVEALLDRMWDEYFRPVRTHSPMAEARRAAKALARQQPKKKREKRRKFRKGGA